MALAKEDIEQIQSMIQRAIAETPAVGNANVRYELELRERTVRVEEELKHQRELMLKGFAQTEKRFEQVEKRFEQIDKHFEQVEKRFEQIDKRFERVEKRLELVEKRLDQVDKRLEQIDKQFEQMDKRFEQVDKRFEQVDKQLEKLAQGIFDIHLEIKQQMKWTFAMMISVAGLIIAILKITG